jgi:MoaA/NifB/PqqE/SkfB family radical SAM enzyme
VRPAYLREMSRNISLTYRCNRQCSYCYAKNLNRDFPQDLSLENFKKILEWFKSQNIPHFNVLGGEPTIHPKFNDMLKLTNENNLRVRIFTNNLFNQPIFKNNAGCIESVRVNFNKPTDYKEDEKKIFDSNLSFLHDNNFNIVLCFNITPDTKYYDYFIDTCLKYNVNQVFWATTCPGLKKENLFVEMDELKNMTPFLIDFVQSCIDQGVFPLLIKSLPLCIFDSYERLWLRKKADLRGVCGMPENIYVINPDLTLFPCTILQIGGPNILSFKKEGDISKFYEEKIKELRQKPLFEKCKECKDYKRGICQGG